MPLKGILHYYLHLNLSKRCYAVAPSAVCLSFRSPAIETFTPPYYFSARLKFSEPKITFSAIIIHELLIKVNVFRKIFSAKNVHFKNLSTFFGNFSHRSFVFRTGKQTPHVFSVRTPSKSVYRKQQQHSRRKINVVLHSVAQ